MKVVFVFRLGEKCRVCRDRLEMSDYSGEGEASAWCIGSFGFCRIIPGACEPFD